MSSLEDRIARLRSELEDNSHANDLGDTVGDLTGDVTDPLHHDDNGAGQDPLNGILPHDGDGVDDITPSSGTAAQDLFPWTTILGMTKSSILGEPAKIVDYCNILSGQDGVVITSDPKSITLRSLSPLAVGSRVDVSALIPDGSGILYGNGTTSAAVSPAAALLPPQSTTSIAWIVEYTRLPHAIDQIFDSSLSPASYRDRTLADISNWSNAAQGSGDGSGESTASFQLLGSNLTAPILSLVPWPETASSPDQQQGQASDLMRIFRLSLRVTLSWPGGPAPVPYTLPFAAYFVMSSWQSVFGGDLTQVSNYIPSYGMLAPGWLSKADATRARPDLLRPFQNLFSVVPDSLAPALGKVTTLNVVPTDKSAILPGQVKQIVTSAPQVKVQAALDLSGALTGLVDHAAKLFAGSSAASTVTAAQMNIDKILSAIMSIPVAVDVNGTSIAKTIEPLAGLSAVPNLSTLQNGLGTAGPVPLGNLTGALSTSIDSLVVKPVDDSKLKTNVSGLQASLLPIPQFVDLLKLTTQIPTVDVSLAIKANLLLPGAQDPITIFFDLGKLTIACPRVPIPQMVIMARSSMLTNTPAVTDLLLSMDPDTMQLFPDVSRAVQALTLLNQGVSLVLQLLMSGVLQVADLDKGSLPLKALSTLSTTFNTLMPIITQVGVSKITIANFSARNPWPATIDLATGVSPSWYSLQDTATNMASNVTSIIWIGAGRVNNESGWRMTLTLDSWANRNIVVLPSYFEPPSNPQIRAAVLDATGPVAEAPIWQTWPDGEYSVPDCADWAGHVQSLTWIQDSGPVVRPPLQKKKTVRFRYFKLNNTAMVLLCRSIWADPKYDRMVYYVKFDSIPINQSRWTDLLTETGNSLQYGQAYYFGGSADNHQALLASDSIDYIYDNKSQLMVTFDWSLSASQNSYVTEEHREIHR